MIRVHGFIRFVLAVVLATFAVHGHAAGPTKKWSIAAPPVLTLGDQMVTLTIRNETPNGNSSVNSLKVNIPQPAGYTIQVASPPAPTATWSGNITFTATTISISNMSPLKPQDTFTLTFKMSVTGPASPASCPTLNWTGTAWTGSSFSGDTFAQVAPSAAGASSTSTIATGLSLAFVQQPTNAQTNTAIAPPVSVRLTSTCGGGSTATWFNGTVNLASTPGTALVGASVNAVNGTATFPALSVAATGTYRLTATAPSLNLSSGLSQPFTVFEGILACNPQPPYTFSQLPPGVTNINQPGYATGERAEFNKDGSQPCIPVLYTFTNEILAANQITLAWDLLSQPGGAFKYTVTWKPEWVDLTSGLPSRKTSVQWFTDAVGTLSPKVPGRACLSPSLPKPYGTLAAGGVPAGTNPAMINVTVTGTPPAVPFPITIGLGAAGERMLVTSVGAGTNWTVDRGPAVGGPATLNAHAAGLSVMSTPLPLDENNVVMRMCIAEEGWQSYPAGAADCILPPPFPQAACVLFTTTVFDVGDGRMIRD